MGLMYDNGLGVAGNDKEAVKWYLLAAAQGHADALNNANQLKEKISETK